MILGIMHVLGVLSIFYESRIAAVDLSHQKRLKTLTRHAGGHASERLLDVAPELAGMALCGITCALSKESLETTPQEMKI